MKQLIKKKQDIAENSPEAIPEKIPDLPEKEGKALIFYSFFWSLALLTAVPFACIYSGEGLSVFGSLYTILTSPSKLVTDYFELGSLGASFLNAALCGLACNIIMLITRAKPSATLLAGYFLVIAHCFYGLNLINMWPPFLGILVYCLTFRMRFGDLLHLGFFATSLGPFISDFLFRYTLGDRFVFGEPRVTVLGVILALIFGLIAGVLIPALLPGTAKMHRGFNLFKAGLAIGLFGMFAHGLFYNTLGIATPDTVITSGLTDGRGNILFVNIFYTAVFALSIIAGFIGNGCSFKNYNILACSDGWQNDFPRDFGMNLTIINIGFYGLFILTYFNLAFIFTDGVGFTGPSAGVVIAAITFSAAGQTQKNVWPIIGGYTAVSLLATIVCHLSGLTPAWSLTTQGYINGIAFATGLCPFTGVYGRRYGFISGMLHAILCTSTAAMHGGFVLYNGGLTSGLTALLLIPILDFYNVKPKTTQNQ